MSPEATHGNGAGGNGNGAGGFGDFDDFIRDRETGFGAADDPGDPYADFTRERAQSARTPGIDRTIVEAIVRVVDGLAGLAGEAVAPELRAQIERTVRDLLVVLRDLINALIERIDNRRDAEPQVEEIPID